MLFFIAARALSLSQCVNLNGVLLFPIFFAPTVRDYLLLFDGMVACFFLLLCFVCLNFAHALGRILGFAGSPSEVLFHVDLASVSVLLALRRRLLVLRAGGLLVFGGVRGRLRGGFVLFGRSCDGERSAASETSRVSMRGCCYLSFGLATLYLSPPPSPPQPTGNELSIPINLKIPLAAILESHAPASAVLTLPSSPIKFNASSNLELTLAADSFILRIASSSSLMFCLILSMEETISATVSDKPRASYSTTSEESFWSFGGEEGVGGGS